MGLQASLNDVYFILSQKKLWIKYDGHRMTETSKKNQRDYVHELQTLKESVMVQRHGNIFGSMYYFVTSDLM